jgi:hypothetical protein
MAIQVLAVVAVKKFVVAVKTRPVGAPAMILLHRPFLPRDPRITAAAQARAQPLAL